MAKYRDDTALLFWFYVAVAVVLLAIAKHEADKTEAHVLEHCLKQTGFSKHTVIHKKYYCMNKGGDWVKLRNQP